MRETNTLPLVGLKNDDEGFRHFTLDSEGEVPFNLSETRIWVLDESPQCLQDARVRYFDIRCRSKLRAGNWKTATKPNGKLRYLHEGLENSELRKPASWQHLAQPLTAEGINYFFNQTVYQALFQGDDVCSIVDDLYTSFLRGRASKNDRTVNASLFALFCMHASGMILLPMGWASPNGGIRQVWPGSDANLSTLLNRDERLFEDSVQEQLKGAWITLGIDGAKGTHAKRLRQSYLVLKLLLSALPPGFSVSDVNGKMFIAAVELLVLMREAKLEHAPIGRDRNISNLRLVWNAIAPHRVSAATANEETRRVRDFVTSFVHRTGSDAARDLHRRKRGHQMRKEGDLRWVVEEAPHLEHTVEMGREFIRSGTSYVSATLSRGFEKIFEYLIDRPDRIEDLFSLNREDFRAGGQCCLEDGGFPSFIDYVRGAHDVQRNPNKGSNKGVRSDNQMNHILNSALNFLEWCRDNKNPNYHIPLYRSDIPSQNRRGWNNGKSTKLPVPIRVLNLCRTILTENDYAFPRSIEHDYVLVTDSDGVSKFEWCPVRAIAMLMLFSLPLRGVSVRRIDSGEGDEFLYDSTSGKWELNKLPIAEKGRSVGVIHRVLEINDDGKPLGGFFVNSNKTQNAKVKLTSSHGPNKSAFSFGYIIPWNNHDLFRHLAFCRDWQIKNNPVSAPRGLDSVSDHSMRVTESVARSLPEFYFLFRDPTAGNDPVSSHKLSTMFELVLNEASKRLAEEEGQEIPLSQYYTLHSLRVGGITAFMKAGMPLGVLTEFIAGHSTIIMNLYYQRHSVPELDRIISEAAKNLESGGLVEEELFDRVAQISEDLPIGPDGSFMSQGLVFRDKEAFEFLRKSQKGLTQIDIDGCCPVGGSMCDLGGPVNTRGEAGYNLLGVQGCATCRFFVTGEPFLPGMVIKANEAIFNLRTYAGAIRDLETELAICNDGLGTGKRRMLQSRLDSLNQETEQLMLEWSARIQTILMTTGQLRASGDKPDSADLAILISKEQVSFEEGSEFHLTDFLARSAEVIQLSPSISEEVKLRRRVMLDRLLGENGCEPFLFTLSDEDAHRSASKLVDLLVGVVGWKGLDAAVERKATLAEVGFDVRQLKTLDKLSAPSSIQGVISHSPAGGNDER